MNIPKGWPTEEMIEEAQHSLMDEGWDGDCVGEMDIKSMFIRMIEVAPTPPAQERNDPRLVSYGLNLETCIADMPRVSEALANFAENTTGDNAAEVVRAIIKCKCDLRTKLVGDGCETCNPELAAEMKTQEDEPVAWVSHHKGGDNLTWCPEEKRNTPLYTHPQSDELRKAAEDAGDLIEELTSAENYDKCNGAFVLANLRAALEGE